LQLALAGAFPFPAAQGSQVYVAEQLQALEAAGASCQLVSYAQLPALIAPRRIRSGPSWRKPLADAALTVALIAACRSRPVDALLAHNAEAAVAGILARTLTGVPVVYVAHTILRYELSAYGPSPWRAALDRIGAAVDGWISRRADGIVALSEDAQRLLAPQARCPIAVIPPGLDLHAQPEEPDPQLIARVCASAGVEPGRFALYAGNLDAYQGLDLLDAAASLLGTRELPVVVATHDARDGRRRHPNLRIVELGRFGEMRALQFAAGALVLTRRRPGGFPIKLLNYMETGRPIVAFEGIAPGLQDDVHACLLAPGAGPEQLARVLRELRADEARALRLGAAARKHLVEHHAWPDLARKTLDFVAKVSRGAA
jgi:glycosyltransferase involved in cell wall biosynthesis